MMRDLEIDTCVRVAYIIDSITCDTSGTERQLLEIIKRLDKKKFSPHLILLHNSKWVCEHSLPCSYTVLDYKGFLKVSLFRVLNTLIKLNYSQKNQIVQTFFEDAIFVAWLANIWGKEKKIVLLSSRRDIGLGEENQPWYHKLFEIALPFVNRRFDGILVNSREVRDYVVKREKTAPRKIEVIYNGVSLPQPPDKIPQVFVDNQRDVWITIVASLTPVKRHELLIQAVAGLAGRVNGKKIKVLVLGKGSQKKRLMNLTEQYDVQDLFLFVGAVHNVTDYLHSCDIGVLCSDREGLSNAILEYMACGLPVVATAVGGNTELVRGDNGICVPPDDSAALANALQDLICDKQKRTKMGLMSRDYVERKFLWQRSMQHLEEYYGRKILAKGVSGDQ